MAAGLAMFSSLSPDSSSVGFVTAAAAAFSISFRSRLLLRLEVVLLATFDALLATFDVLVATFDALVATLVVSI